jgi:hypothetical protein
MGPDRYQRQAQVVSHARRPASRFHRHRTKTRTFAYLDFVELMVRQFNQFLEQGRDSSRPQMEADHVEHCDSQWTEQWTEK